MNRWLFMVAGLLGLPGLAGEVDWEAARKEALRLQPSAGLHLDVWAAEPQLQNGVAFSFDEQGRCYIAETHRYGRSIFDITQKTNWLSHDLSFRTGEDRKQFLLSTFNATPALLTADSELVRVVEDAAQTGHATQSVIVATNFNSVLDGTAAGILAQSGNVWFGNIPSLWKLGLPEKENQRSALATGFGVHIGVTGHDLHGLIHGPDGRLYMSFGDRGAHLTSQEGMTIDLPDTGGVLRCEPDGSHLEVYCSGLRNPQELAFDDLGNLWTVDNDTAGADPCRVLFLLPGADYGWRCSYQHQDGFGPWVKEELWKGGKEGILPLSGTVSQGPSGLAWYPGTGFGPNLAGHFLHCDFPQGIVSFSVEATGAGFKTTPPERFLWNCWATDVDFGPDGAVYVLDWLSGWQMPNKGRIYRITAPEFMDRPEMAEVRRLLKEGFQTRSYPTLTTLLGHRDRRVRLCAQSELVRRGSASLGPLMEFTSKDGPTLGRLHALWAMGELVRAESPAHVSTALLESLTLWTKSADLEVRGQAMALLSQVDPGQVPSRISTSLVGATPRLRLQTGLALAAALTRTGSNSVPMVEMESLGQLLREILGPSSPDPWIEHAVILSLAALEEIHPLGTGPIQAWLSDPHTSIRRVGILAARHRALTAFQRGQPIPVVSQVGHQLESILNDPIPELVEEAGRAIHEIPMASAFPALARMITRVDLSPALCSRVINANLWLGGSQQAQAVANFALRRDVPPEGRVAALGALAEWGRPNPIDRVNGLWRPMITGRTSDAVSTTAGEKDASEPAGKMRLPQARFAGGPTAPLPVDLGRSASYDEGYAVKRNDQAARRAFLRVAGEILNPQTPDANGVVLGGPEAPESVQRAVVQTAVALRTREASHALADQYHHPKSSAGLRATIVTGLVQLQAAEATDIVSDALQAKEPEVQEAAITSLALLDGDRAPELLNQIVLDALAHPGPSVIAAQTALGALGRMVHPSGGVLLSGYLERLENHQWPGNLTLDLNEAAAQSSNVDLQRRAERVSVRIEEVTNRAAWQPWLNGGNAQRGARVFGENPTVQCTRCHRLANEGGTVGPALDGVGNRAIREELLESVVFPNARLATGFEVTVLTLSSNATVSGTIKAETAGELTIETTNEQGQIQRIQIPKASIVQRQPGPSAMPEGLSRQLRPTELRDLVEFLSSLR